MKLENGRALLFCYAYYKKRYVNVPLPFLPEGAITNEGTIVYFSLVPVDNPPKIDPLPIRESKAAEKYAAFADITINPEDLPDRELKQLCKMNDIPLGWVTDRFSKKKGRSEGESRRGEKRKIKSLSQNESKKIIKELKKIDLQSALIIEILCFLNSSLMEGGGYVTLEEILHVMIQDFLPEEETRPAQICLKRSAGSSHLISHFLPEELGQRIFRQIASSSRFIFTNRHGGPLLPVKVDADLRRAGENVGIKGVTSLSLRPQFDRKKVAEASINHQNKVALDNCPVKVTDQGWEKICNRIPSINHKKGRRSSYAKTDLLNGILYHLKTPCSFRKLPSSFPPWRAVESQFRRWKERGIFEAIIGLLSSG